MKNRVASVLAKLYGDTSQAAAQNSLSYPELKGPGVPTKLVRLVTRELKRIKAIAAAHRDVQVKVVDVVANQNQVPTILVQVRVLPSRQTSGPLEPLKTALARDSLLQNVRLVLFKRLPKPKRS